MDSVHFVCVCVSVMKHHSEMVKEIFYVDYFAVWFLQSLDEGQNKEGREHC